MDIGASEQRKLVREARSAFSRIGFSYVVATLLIIGMELSVSRWLSAIRPDGNITGNTSLVCNMLPRFLIVYPVVLLLISLNPKGTEIPKRRMKAWQIVVAFIMAYAVAMFVNVIANVGNLVFELLRDHSGQTTAAAESLLDLHPFWLVLFVCVGAPIYEELIFRKALIDRTVRYGEGISIVLSGVFFGLFHGNLPQAMFATVLGSFFAYIYIKTGEIRYTMLLHFMINSVSAVAMILLRMIMDGMHDFVVDAAWVYHDFEKFMKALIQVTGSSIGLLVWLCLVFVLVVAGIVLWIINGKKLLAHPVSSSVLPKGKRFSTAFLNVGVLAFVVIWLVIIGSSLFA